jgi:ABC-2 type transport system permease protein
MRTTLTIAKREFRSYFDSPLAYVVVCLSLFVLGLWFFVGPAKFWQVDRATLAGMFEALPLGLVILVVPVVTMRLLAEEKRSGTLEMLITLPVSDSEVILGKYIGALGLVLTFLAATLAYPVLMFSVFGLGTLDGGPVLSGYLGLLLFSASTVAIGLAISSYFDSQVIAFFVTFIGLVGLWTIGDLGALLGGPLGNVVQQLSFKEHFQPFPRGLVDTSDVVFFLSFTIFPLMLAFRSLESRKWA